jgi:hypothetical protein
MLPSRSLAKAILPITRAASEAADFVACAVTFSVGETFSCRFLFAAGFGNRRPTPLEASENKAMQMIKRARVALIELLINLPSGALSL